MDYQSITIVGNVGRDPKISHLPNQSKVAKFSVAINRNIRSGDQETLWFQVDAWDWLAEVADKYLHAGNRVLVEGELIGDPKTHGPKIFLRGDQTVGTSFVIRAEKIRLLDTKANEVEKTARRETPATGEYPVPSEEDPGADDIPF